MGACPQRTGLAEQSREVVDGSQCVLVPFPKRFPPCGERLSMQRLRLAGPACKSVRGGGASMCEVGRGRWKDAKPASKNERSASGGAGGGVGACGRAGASRVRPRAPRAPPCQRRALAQGAPVCRRSSARLFMDPSVCGCLSPSVSLRAASASLYSGSASANRPAQQAKHLCGLIGSLCMHAQRSRYHAWRYGLKRGRRYPDRHQQDGF